MIISQREDKIPSLGNPLNWAKLQLLISVNLGLQNLPINISLIDQSVLDILPIAVDHIREQTDFLIGQSSIEQSQESIPAHSSPRGSLSLIESKAHLNLIPSVSQSEFLLQSSSLEIQQVILHEETGEITTAFIL